MKKNMVIIGSLLILLGAAVTCSATSDSTGDVWHYTYSGTSWTWERYTGEKPNIDITDISYTTSGGKTTVTLTVAGNIVDSPNIYYYIYLVSDSLSSFAYYSNGIEYMLDPVSVGTNTGSKAGSNSWSVTFNVDASSGSYSVYGYALEYSDINQATNGEYWGDWAPDNYFPAYDQYYGNTTGNTGNEGTGGNETGENTTGGETGGGSTSDETGGATPKGGTPGFELIFAVFAIAMALIFLKRKR